MAKVLPRWSTIFLPASRNIICSSQACLYINKLSNLLYSMAFALGSLYPMQEACVETMAMWLAMLKHFSAYFMYFLRIKSKIQFMTHQSFWLAGQPIKCLTISIQNIIFIAIQQHGDIKHTDVLCSLIIFIGTGLQIKYYETNYFWKFDCRYPESIMKKRPVCCRTIVSSIPHNSAVIRGV